jgi:hypothetical protein
MGGLPFSIGGGFYSTNTVAAPPDGCAPPPVA